MNRYQAEHRRILAMVDLEDWQAFSSEDELTLRALILTGYLSCAPALGELPKIRIRLTFKGRAYLEHIGQLPRVLAK